MNVKRLNRTGFTLVEILVVLAIIAVLAALLFPLFSRVREQGRRSTCQSNLKQIALAMQQYVSDFDGRYPSSGINGIDGKQWAPSLFPYVHNRQIFVCPTRGDVGEIGALNVGPGLNYDFNAARLNRGGVGTRVVVGRSEAALPLSSLVWLNSDGPYESSPHSHPGPAACGDGWFSRWYYDLHSGGSNYSFVDGHVKWLSPAQAEAIECELGAPNFRAG